MPTNYPFDPTGTNPANRITNEVHVITPVNAKLFNFFVAEQGPFFKQNFSMTFRNPDNSVWTMVEGVDYYFSHTFLSASKACAREVYGSVTFLNNQVQGVVTVSYNTVGGTWVVTPNQLTEIMANVLFNPRTTTWEQIVDLPFQFPVVDHEWNLVDMVGMSSVVEELEKIYDVLLASTGGGLQTHIQNLNNPHGVTKTQVQLGNVQNYAIATLQEAQSGTSNTAYMTPLRVAQAITALASSGSIGSHLGDTNNPHGTTKSQVNLGNVDNYATASQPEAESGALNDRFMTPLRTKQAIVTHLSTYDTHLGRTDNPHGTDKTQVGLANVQNYPVATLQQAQAGSVDNVYMTPSKTSAAITALALTPLTVHVNRTDNPHGTNKTHVGLSLVQNYPISSLEEAQAGTSNTAYMTPLRVAQAIAALASSGSIGSHLADTDNPHSTTANQVGAYTKSEVDDLVNQRLGSTQTAANSTLFAGRTFANAKIEFLDGQASDTLLMVGLTPPQLLEAYGIQRDTHPVSYITTSQYVWYKLAICGTNTEAPSHELNEALDRYRAVQLLFAGGTMSGGTSNTAAEYRAPQLIYLTLTRTGQNYETKSLTAINLMHDPSATGLTAPQVMFGYVNDPETDQQSIYVRVLKEQPGFAITKLDGLTVSTSTEYYGDTEPVGIQYSPLSNGTMGYPPASAIQATTGTDNRSVMTPLRVAQAIAALGSSGSSGSLLAVRVFEPNDTGVVYTPTAGATKALVKIQAGGGAGGASRTTISNQANAGTGGAAGGFTQGFYATSALNGAVLTIGAGGALCPAGTAPGSAQVGGDTSFGTILTAEGGDAGTLGTIVATPGYRQDLGPTSPGATGGNITEWFDSNGGTAMVIGTMAIGGSGAASHFGPGMRGSAADGSTVASASGGSSINPGCGGAGAACSNSGPAAAGGQGSDGVIIVYEYA